MKVLLRCVCSVFLLGWVGNLYAQLAPSAIKGKVLTETRSPAENATVVLLKFRDSTIVSSAVADKKGLFQFGDLQPDSYLVLITQIGYKKNYAGPYRVETGKTVTTHDIVLTQLANQLKEVSIVGNKPQVEVKPGKVILNVQSNIMAAGSSVYDILRESPGVRVDNNNNISIVGRQNALITIDGKQTNLSGDDLLNVLRSLQSNTIDYIELITNGSAKYDAAGGGIINIVLKKGKNVGANATLTGSLGYGRYDKNSEGIVFNYRTEKFNVFGKFDHSYNHTFHDFMVNRIVDDNGVPNDYHTNYNSVQQIYTNTFSLGADYFLSANHTIGFYINGIFTDNAIEKNNSLKISAQSVLDSTILANSNLSRHFNVVNYNVNYAGKLDNTGKTLSADLNYSTNGRSSAEYITNNFYNAQGNMYRDPLLSENLSPSNLHTWVSTVNFTDPISKTSKLEAGLKYSNVTSNNNVIFGSQVNGLYEPNPLLSNYFIYTENVNAGFVSYENKFNKLMLNAELRAEQTNDKGNSVTSGDVVNRDYFDLFPHLLVGYQYDDKHDFSISYSRGIRRPDYATVNPFLYYVDIYDYGQGNPYLKPQYTNSVELSYIYNKSISTTLYTSIVSDAYEFKFFRQDDDTRVNVNITTNLGTIYNYGIRFFTPVIFTHWWNGNFFADAAYQRYISYPVNGNLNKGTPDIILKSTQNFIISNTFTADISGSYESSTFYGISQFKAAYQVGAGLSKQLFNKRGSLKLSVADVFNTLRDRYSINYQNLNLISIDKVESQIARLTFTYRLGKISVKSIVHHTGNEEEQKRTGSGAEN